MGLALVLGAGLLLSACPDPEGGYNDFLDRTADARLVEDVSVDTSSGDFSGTYLMGVAVVIDPDPPLMLAVTVAVQGEPGSQTVDFSFQPIKTDNVSAAEGGGPRSDARTPTGDPVVVNGIALENGQFEVSLEGANILGDANPVTYRDITVTLTLSGFVTSDTSFCGTVTGGVTAPAPIDVSGSTFGAVQADDPAAVTTVPSQCETGDGSGS